jgi:hypothetical protein|tara:strand:+ start:312 stop:773 length:462 start_codon:yes stop_codon:yes gene_type:complete
MTVSEKLKTAQAWLEKGNSVSDAASLVGWSRQRLHRYFAEGTLVSIAHDTDVKASTKVSDDKVKHLFGTYIGDVLRRSAMGPTMQAAAKHMPSIILSVGHAYNAPIIRLANFFLKNCNVRKADMGFISFCADETVDVRDKIAVAKYISHERHG